MAGYWGKMHKPFLKGLNIRNEASQGTEQNKTLENVLKTTYSRKMKVLI
jgi:lambda repressor-like predicted transcriptional regulator